MDPSQALREAEECLRAGEPAEAAEALARYRAWRHRGGFEPPGGDRLADELQRRLTGPAAPGPVRASRSCSWCHALNETAERSCKDCGHEAHVARADCACPRCRLGPGPLTEEDVEAALAELRRLRGERGKNRGDSMTTPDGAARALYLRQFREAFEDAAGRPLPEGFEDAEVEAYRRRGVPPAEATRDFLETYWQGGRLLP